MAYLLETARTCFAMALEDDVTQRPGEIAQLLEAGSQALCRAFHSPELQDVHLQMAGINMFADDVSHCLKMNQLRHLKDCLEQAIIISHAENQMGTVKAGEAASVVMTEAKNIMGRLGYTEFTEQLLAAIDIDPADVIRVLWLQIDSDSVPPVGTLNYGF
jgi:hypothetical protein